MAKLVDRYSKGKRFGILEDEPKQAQALVDLLFEIVRVEADAFTDVDIFLATMLTDSNRSEEEQIYVACLLDFSLKNPDGSDQPMNGEGAARILSLCHPNLKLVSITRDPAGYHFWDLLGESVRFSKEDVLLGRNPKRFLEFIEDVSMPEKIAEPLIRPRIRPIIGLRNLVKFLKNNP